MSRVFVIIDGYFSRTNGDPSSNHVWYENFWSRYLAGFENVTIITRVGDRVDPKAKPITGPGVDVLELPDIREMVPFLIYIPRLLILLFKLPRDASYILRIPGFITALAGVVLIIRRIPFGVEVIADPSDLFTDGASGFKLSKILHWFLVSTTKLQCKKAAASSYVTAHALQKRYPPGKDKPTFNYTSLNLQDEDYVDAPRTADQFNLEKPTLVNVAMMHQNLKAQDVLLQAFAIIRDKGIDAQLVFIGDGNHREIFEQLGRDLGVENYVRYTGLIAKGEPLLNEIDNADLFVLPSRQEGLPRAMLEAMARALPCVATNVGGASELVPEDELVARGDVNALADMLIKQLSNAENLAAQSKRNLDVAKRYHRDTVSKVRECFYKTLADTQK